MEGGRRAFVGRGTELARLRAALAATSDGHARTIIVAGEAGIGKSRLLARFGEVASQAGARVLEGVCLEAAEGGVPYGPFVEILRELVRDTPPERLPAVLGPARGDLARLLPELTTRAADLPAASELDRAARARLFELVLGIFERLAEAQPLVLEIEDVHWADPATRELLGFLFRGLRDNRVLILLTLRTDQRGVAAGNLELIAELEREDDVERLDVMPFGRDEVEAQLTALRGVTADPDDVERLLARSDGNPFYVEELALAGEGGTELPPVLRDVLVARVASLPEASRAVLRAAAVGGRRIDDELLQRVLDVPVRALADALRDAVASGILTRDERFPGRPVSFRHALLQDVVADELFTAERIGLHAAYAQALEGSPPAAVPVSEVARHWDAARRPDRALAPTIAAAQAAERAFAFDEAHRLWARAEVLAGEAPEAAAQTGQSRPELLEHAADAAVLAGAYAEAVALGRAAVEATDASADPARAGHLHDRLRWYLWESGDRRAAAAAVAAALELLPSTPPTLGRARALAQQAGIMLYAGEYESAIEIATEAIAVAREVDAPGEEALALGVLGWSQAVLGDPEAGLARFREGQAIAERLQSVEGIALAAFNLASLLDRIGHSEASLEAAAAGYAITERLGVARTYGGLLLGFRAKAEFLLGRWDEADASTALGLRRGATDRAELWLTTNRARLLTARGAFDLARDLLTRARTIDTRLGGTEFETPLLTAEAELAVAERRIADLRRIAARGIELASKPGPPDPSLAWLAATVLRGEADRAAETRSRGASTAQDEETAAVLERIDAAMAGAAESARELLIGSARGRALLELLWAERERLGGTLDSEGWTATAEAFEAAGRPYPAAYAHYRVAEATLATRGDRATATAALRTAAETARRLGATPLLVVVTDLARQARLDLGDAVGQAATAQPPRSTADALGLTEREREVLRLVAGGWTNQQIADHLFITRKTASVHVSNLMAKLGVEGRGAAAAAAYRLSLVDGVPPAPPEPA